MRVQQITLRELRLPLREPFRISSGVVSDRHIFLLELRDADGVVEWAECVAGEQPNYTSETVETAWMAITSWLAPRIFAADVSSPAEVHGVLDRDLRGHSMAKAAIEMGCWGLAARRAGVSLSNFIGGTRDRVVTGISLGIQVNPDALVSRAQ